MPEVASTLTLKAVPMVEFRPIMAHIAVGAKLPELQTIIQLDADKNAPHFDPGSEPETDGKAYKARDGNEYFRPILQIAQRTAPLIGPEVRFLKDAEGKIRLQFELEEKRLGSLPAAAVPFNVRIIQVLLEWTESGSLKQHVFPPATLAAEDTEQDPDVPDFFIRVGEQLDPDEVEAIHRAMSAQSSEAKLNVQLKFGYFIESTSSSPDPGHRSRPESTVVRAVEHLEPVSATVIATPRRAAVSRTAVTHMVAHPVSHIAASTITASAATTTPVMMMSGIHLVRTLDPAAIKSIRDAARERENSEAFKEKTITREISFSFDPNLDQNRHIYSAIRGDESFIEDWTSTPNGFVRKSSFANTVYRIPDEMRLNYNPELGSPHLLPSLYRDEEDNVRVRVTMRLAPWHNPKKVVALRDDLERATSGALLNPAVIVGGYSNAKIRLTSAFPEEITSITAEELPISLETGTDLTLDLTLEFYRYLAQLLTGPVGLSGEVSVSLSESDASDEDAHTVPTKLVPVRVTLDDLASLPIDLGVDANSISPTTVSMTSKAHGPVNVEDCEIRLLQWDDNSVTPLTVLRATAASSFPLQLSANTPSTLEISPEEDAAETFWNAVQVDLVGTSLEETPEDCLNRIHEIAPSASLSWVITADCPPFQQAELPEAFQNLYMVEAQISRPGFSTKQVVLNAESPTAKITMDRSLKEILATDAEGVFSFSYRIRNIYFDHQGSWSEDKTAEGSSFFVFPNPIDGD